MESACSPSPKSVRMSRHATPQAERVTVRGGSVLTVMILLESRILAPALALGRRLGQRVLFLSVSTGGTLATWMGMRPEGREGVVHVMMSPNFGPRHPLAEVVNWPWGRQLARWIEGDMRGPQPRNAAEAQAWTSPYPTQAVFPMMALVKQVRQSDLSAFTAPVLVLYAEGDQTVDPAQTKAAFARLGSAQKTLLRVDDSESPGQHVLAGERLAPRSTGPRLAF